MLITQRQSMPIKKLMKLINALKLWLWYKILLTMQLWVQSTLTYTLVSEPHLIVMVLLLHRYWRYSILLEIMLHCHFIGNCGDIALVLAMMYCCCIDIVLVLM